MPSAAVTATAFLVLAVAACAGATAPESSASSPRSDAGVAPPDASREASASPVPSVSPPALPSPEAQGEVLVAERGCPRCHQSSDPRDGVLSGQTEPRPGSRAYGPNLTPDDDTGLGGWSDPMVERAIREGLADDGSPLCLEMPRFADLADDEVAAIVAYLRSLVPVRRRIPESACGLDADAGSDAGAGGGGICADLVPPGAPAACHACAGRTCQPNGCFNGWWCVASLRGCVPPPDACAP